MLPIEIAIYVMCMLPIETAIYAASARVQYYECADCSIVFDLCCCLSCVTAKFLFCHRLVRQSANLVGLDQVECC